MNRFASWARSQISAKGPMRLGRFMQQALSDPEFGYYSQAGRIGKAGDFVTAPEISSLFGEMLAALMIYLWDLSGRPANSQIFEAGPGTGQLMADLRHVFARLAPPLAAAPLHLLEASPALRSVQQDRLAGADICFHDDCTALPPAPLFGVANEFFDALGVDQAIFLDQSWHHHLIGLDGDSFAFVTGPPLSARELRQFGCPAEPAEGAIHEFSPSGIEIISQLGQHIAKFGGALLILDYGGSQLVGSSLQAVRAHERLDPLEQAGAADLTHLVDFGRLADSAAASGARLIGPVEQGRFLLELGIAARAEALARQADSQRRHQLRAAIDRLTSPAWMGSLFKAALLVPPGSGLPPGFTSLDQTGQEQNR